MPDYKRYGIAGATLATILLTGQIMQTTSATNHASAADVQAMPLPVAISDIKLTAADEATLVTASLDSSLAAPQGTQQPLTSETCKVTL